jgi:hypothetical protein
MHKIIRIIVYANDEQDAYEQAEKILDNLTTCQTPYDYYTILPYDYYTILESEEDDKSRASGTGGFGKVHGVVLADSQTGREMIAESMEHTFNTLKKAWKEVRKLILTSTSKAFFFDECEDKIYPTGLGRYYFNLLGFQDNTNAWIYDNDGEAILNQVHLRDVLEKWNKKEYQYNDIFIVSADVHY